MRVYDLKSRYEHLPEALLGEARKTLAGAHRRAAHAVSQLDDADLWWRPHESMNAAGNIVLHLCGNMSQWIFAGVGGREYKRDRPAEFAQRDGMTQAELLDQLHEVVKQADAVLSELATDDLIAPRRIQAFETTVAGAIFHAISHFEGHAQELIYIARLRRGETYQFLWTPSDAQQASP